MFERRKTRDLAIGIVILATLVARLWLIAHFPEPDSDAKGHLSIARALLAHPMNVSVHWVYLPAYHYILAALEGVGLGANAIRVLNCLLAAFVPLGVVRYAEATRTPRHIATMAALLSGVSPLVNLLGTSAQQETLFSLLVLGAVWAIDVRRFFLAGWILAVASLVRYEAWGAVAMLVAYRLVSKRIGAPRFPAVVVAPPIVAICAWLTAHRIADGTWFGFLRELYRFTHVQRVSIHRPTALDLIWFPLEQPIFVFGWIVAILFFIGVRRAWRASWVVPLGIYLFLQGAYLFKGALGGARYYDSLVPFVALAAAHGACVIGAEKRWVVRSVFAVAFVQLLVLSAETIRWTWPHT